MLFKKKKKKSVTENKKFTQLSFPHLWGVPIILQGWLQKDKGVLFYGLTNNSNN